MKIVGGYARGVELAELGDQQGVRPTIGRSREALFNALGDPAYRAVYITPYRKTKRTIA